MEDGVHIAALVEDIEYRTRYIGYALRYNPYYGSCVYTIDKGLEGNKHGEPHANETKCFYATVAAKMYETDYGAGNGAQPYEDKQSPPPERLIAQCDERDRRI